MSLRARAYAASQIPLRAQVLREAQEMAEFAFARGKRVPAWVVQTLHSALATPASGDTDAVDEIKRLAVAHEALSRIVAPATPQALVLLDEESDSSFNWMGPVPFVRRMALAAVVMVVAFVALSLSNAINDPANGSITGADGVELLINELFFMSAAGMGAAFHALFEVNKYIVNRTFDPRYEVSYWIKFLLGLIAGLIMVTLVPLDASSGGGFARPTVAMLGGFSAAAVYRILVRLVDTLESLVQGDAKSLLEQRERVARMRSDQDVAQQKMKMTSELVALQQQLAAGVQGDDLRNQLNQIVNSMMVGDAGDGAPPEASRTVSVPNMPIVSAPAGDAPAATQVVAPAVPAADPEPRALAIPDAEDMSDGEVAAPVAVAAAPVSVAAVTVASASEEEEAVG